MVLSYKEVFVHQFLQKRERKLENEKDEEKKEGGFEHDGNDKGKISAVYFVRESIRNIMSCW